LTNNIVGVLQKTIDEQMAESKARGDNPPHATIHMCINQFPIQGTVLIDGEHEPYRVGIIGDGSLEITFRKRDVYFDIKHIIAQAINTIVDAGVLKPEPEPLKPLTEELDE